MSTKIVGSVLYHIGVVNITLLMALSNFASEQSKAAEFTMDTIEQPLDYCAAHPNAKVRYKKSDTILNIHSEALCLVSAKVKRCTAGHYFFSKTNNATNETGKSMFLHLFCGL